MHIGLMIFPTAATIQPTELGIIAEERGFESLWFPEHSHIPVSRATPWGGREGAPPLPDHYWRSYDQVVALTAVAAATTKLRLGTGISLVAQHDPLWLAKQIATLDQLSEGRLILGLGRGSAEREYKAFGAQMERSRQTFDERATQVLSMLAGVEPGVEIRPHLVAPLEDRVAIAARSPASLEVAGELGARLLLIPQKPWDEVAIDTDRHAAACRRVQGREPPTPIVVTCD